MKKDSKSKPKDKKYCSKCEKDKKMTDFYSSYSPLDTDGKLRLCKLCIQDMVDITNLDSVKNMLRMIDKAFVAHLWESASSKSSPIGEYFKLINAKDFRHFTWDDSIFELNEVREIDLGEQPTPKQQSKFVASDEIVNKWGFGYLPEEYKAFEQKYSMLKNNYQEKTAMHTEALLTYIRYRVKEELATAKDDMKSAKEWGQLAQKAAQDAKINPSQLSKSDLSDGLDTFGQLVRSVEQAVDIIPILPHFKERPQDKVDFTLWCYINYVRDLKGLPLATYEEIYSFYEQRRKDYESSAGGFDGEL